MMKDDLIEDNINMFPVNLSYIVNVSCNVICDGWRPKPIGSFITLLQRYLPHNLEIRCDVTSTTVPKPYDIYWKVKNVGPEAERRNELRGQILDRGKTIVEHTKFYGNHYIECYIIKDGVCVAKKRIEVPIGKR